MYLYLGLCLGSLEEYHHSDQGLKRCMQHFMGSQQVAHPE